MDQHGATGPEKPGYQEDLQAIATWLESDSAVYVVMAAAMTKFKLLLTPPADTMSLGQTMPEDVTMVSVVSGDRTGVHTFAVGTWHSTDYVGAKLWGVGHNPVDALIVGGFLNRIERQRLRMRDDLSMENLERWEWQEYERIEIRAGSRPSEARFCELTGAAYGDVLGRPV